MLRWLTIVFVVVLIMLVAAPAGIGHVAAARQQFLVDELSRTLPGTVLVTESVETGWLTSRLRHRVAVNDARLLELTADLVARPGREEPPVVVIDSLIAHGPWPLLKGAPGLARVRSTLLLLGSDGSTVRLPGEAITDIGFTGAGHTILSLSEIRQPLPDGRGLFSIDAVDATVYYNRNLTHMRSYLKVQRAELVSPRGAIEAEYVQLQGETRRSPELLWSSESSLSLGRFLLTDPLGDIIQADGLRLNIVARSENGLLEHMARIRIDALATPLSATHAIRLDASAGRLDAAAVSTLVERARQDGQLTSEPDILRDLVHAGPFIEIQNLVVSGDTGELRFALHVEVPEDEATDVHDTADLLSVLEGTGQLSIDAALLHQVLGSQDLSADPDGFVSLGFLRPDNDRFIADLRIDGGLITINDLPLPINR